MSCSTIITPPGFDKKAYGEVVRLSAPGAPTLTFVEKGLHITSIVFKDGQGSEHDIIVGSNDPEHYVDQKAFRNCLVGRYCNRLPSETPLSIGRDSITLPAFPAPGQSLHGGPGPNGWDDKILRKVNLDDAQLFSSAELEYLREKEQAGSGSVWTLTSPDGENGHIGTILCEVALVVSAGKGTAGDVTLVYRAKLLDGDATALNLTQHWGFNLAASAVSRGSPTSPESIGIHDHILRLQSKHLLSLDPINFLPTGKLIPLASVKEKDFGGKGKAIGRKGAGYPEASKTESKLEQGFAGAGYDDFWVFDREGKSSVIVQDREKAELNVFSDIANDTETVATLSNPAANLSIAFTTNQPGLQAWSGAGIFDGQDARKALHGGKSQRGEADGYVDEPPTALAMEFHAIYGAWMHPELKDLGWDTILRKGEIYNNWVKLSIATL